MKWISISATRGDVRTAVREAGAAVRVHLGSEVDFAALFLTPACASALEQIVQVAEECVPARCLFGCLSKGVIGGGKCFEGREAFALTAARLPGVAMKQIVVDTEEMPDEDAPPEEWRQWIGFGDWKPAFLLVVAHPLAPEIESLLGGLDYIFPSATILGGLAGGGAPKYRSVFFDGRDIRQRGVLLTGFSGNIAVRPALAHKFRPIGRPLTVTGCEDNFLLEVDGLKPLRYLAELLDQLDDNDKSLMRHSLLLGISVDTASGGSPDSGFLIRNLVGIDYARGTLAVGAPLREGMLVQFHLRDHQASLTDLRNVLSANGDFNPAGALVFAGAERSRRHHLDTYHEPTVFSQTFGPTPLAGFIGLGEIAPAGGVTCLHDHTSAFALIKAAETL